MSADGAIDLDRLQRSPAGDYVAGFGADEARFSVEVVCEPPELAVQITFTDIETGEPICI